MIRYEIIEMLHTPTNRVCFGVYDSIMQNLMEEHVYYNKERAKQIIKELNTTIEATV